MTKKDIRKAKSVSLLLDSLKSKKMLAEILGTIRMPLWMSVAIVLATLVLLVLLGLAIYVVIVGHDGINFARLNIVNALDINGLGEGQLLSYHDLREMLLISTYRSLSDSMY